MARTAGSDGEKTEAALREAAAMLIARHGYEAMSMRELASAIGLQAAALYRYFPHKQDILFTLMREHMEGLIAARAQSDPGGAPKARLAAFVRNHILFHLARRHATHVSNMELRSLSDENLAAILAMRGAYEHELRAILRQGSADGQFIVDDVELTAMAIIQMITGVIVWFRPDERLSANALADRYLAMTMRLVGVNNLGENLDV